MRDDGCDLAKMRGIFAKEQARFEADGGSLAALCVSLAHKQIQQRVSLQIGRRQNAQWFQRLCRPALPFEKLGFGPILF